MLHKERDRVHRVIQLGKEIPVDNDNAELLGHWGRYACIVCAGYLEVALRLVVREYVQGKATMEIQSFVIKDVESIQNPKAERFVGVMRCFSEKWAHEMDEFFLNNQDAKEAIDSLMANRHLIAHGRPCSISLGRVDGYFVLANKAVEKMEILMGSRGAA